MKTLLLCIIFTSGFYTRTYTQGGDVVLVNGNPPLTQFMAGKAIVLLDWVLDLKLTRQQQNQIGDVIQNAWKQQNKAQIKSTLDVIDVYEQVFKLNATEQDKLKAKLRPVIIENLQKEPKDELSVLVNSFYQSSRSTSSVAPNDNDKPNSRPSINTSANTGKNSSRAGSDGFTGLYRMVRPKSININSSGYESGVYIEHIVFLPGGNLYWRFPAEGLLYFDLSAACNTYPNDCGTYEIRGDEIHVLRGPERKKYIITRNGERLNNPPALGKGSFRRVAACDGLKLEGSYRPRESEPSITFTTNGTFTDAGALRYMENPSGGSGNYLIDQNTLELKYVDGRVKRFAFEAFPENLSKRPAVDNFLVNGQRLERN